MSAAPGVRRAASSLALLVAIAGVPSVCVQAASDGMASTPARTPPPFPLRKCKLAGQPDCIARTGALVQAKQERRRVRFLELWDPEVRQAICHAASADVQESCATDLATLSEYLTPGGLRPDEKMIGVALEGGGSKAAPFSLGVLAGLQEADILPKRVGAVSSVSGGSYAASFLFNRLWDRYAVNLDAAQADGRCSRPVLPGAAATLRKADAPSGDYSDWFRSCVPDAYADPKGALGHLAGLPSCGEKPGVDAPGVTHDFKPEYAFQGHVWQWPDLLFSDQRNQLKTDERLRGPEWVQTGMLTIASVVTSPLQLLSRTLFRWPINTAPSKRAYLHGIDREFGFSPADWKAAANSPEGVSVIAAQRSRERTLACLGAILPPSEPAWILNANTPGKVTVVDWITTSSRDPLTNSFELTPKGYGSGLYGYAMMAPRWFKFDDFASTPQDLSMTDAVVASAAFFDDNQSLISSQPARFGVGLFQHALNLTWFIEIPNFNASRPDRVWKNVQPIPFWGIPEGYRQPTAPYEPEDTPYIHLQDGGNSENTGIFALLRRGYRTIVYVHGTEDRTAQFDGLCHLKNILELHGAYRIDSEDFEQVIAMHGHRNTDEKVGQFGNYLDQLCSARLDESIRAGFGSEIEGTPSPLSRLYCERVNSRDPADRSCTEYRARFPADRTRRAAEVPKTWSLREDLFFRWTGTSLVFTVRRTAAEGGLVADGDVLATIVAITPAIAWKEFREQLSGSASVVNASDWTGFCNREAANASVRVERCAIPPNLSNTATSLDGLTLPVPCTAAAYLVSNACEIGVAGYAPSTGSVAHKFRAPAVAELKYVKPKFPQNSFVSTTLNSSYLMFAAYYDLGRHFARTVGKCLDDTAPSQGWRCSPALLSARVP